VGIQIQEMPVSSAIMTPWQKEVVVHNGEIEVEGKCTTKPLPSP
jgi:sulfite oxidase